MIYKKLGDSELEISEISFGCMSLEENTTKSVNLLKKARDGGINYFDTADLYQKGENEKILGQAFKGIRDKVIIGTKVGNQWRKDGSGWDWNPSKNYILYAVEESLRRLQTDYIDLYQLHGGTIDDPIDETIEAFETLKKQGKIRYYGISSIRPNVIREYVKRSGIISTMTQYSLLDRRPEESSLELLRQNNIGILARGALAKGLLVNKKPISYLNYSEEEVSNAASAIKSISGDQRTPAQSAIRFVLNNPAINTAVVGMRTEEQLDECIQASEAPKLTESELAELWNALEENKYEQHR